MLRQVGMQSTPTGESNGAATGMNTLACRGASKIVTNLAMFFNVNLWNDEALEVYAHGHVGAKNIDGEHADAALIIALTDGTCSLDTSSELSADEPVLAVLFVPDGVQAEELATTKARWMRMQNLLELLVVHESEPFIERLIYAADAPAPVYDSEQGVIDFNEVYAVQRKLLQQRLGPDALVDEEFGSDYEEEGEEYSSVRRLDAADAPAGAQSEEETAVDHSNEEGDGNDESIEMPVESKYGFIGELYKGLGSNVPILSLPEAIPLALEVVYHGTRHSTIDE